MGLYRPKDVIKKEFIQCFDQLCQRHNRWTVWCDLMQMGATSISNAVDMHDHRRWEEREKAYLQVVRKYNEVEMQFMPQLFAMIITSLDQGPDQDFLGELYMNLNLGNSHNGQFFTPYHLCSCMARMNMDGLQSALSQKRWVSVSDPCCGAGGLLVAFANECRRLNINYQTDILFVAQDIDPVVGYMCYIQLSLLGCPGYVVIGDSLTAPTTALDPGGMLPSPGQNIWFTPMFFRDVWQYRQAFAAVDLVVYEGEKYEEKDCTVN